MSEASGIELADEVHLGLKPPVDSPPERGAFVRVYGQMMSAIDTAARVGLFFVLVGELGLILVEVAQRGLSGHSFLWAEQVSGIALLTIAFVPPCGLPTLTPTRLR